MALTSPLLPSRSDPASPPRLAVLDGVRGISIIFVMAAHSAALFRAGGWVGVDIFFVLSGYLITGILLDEQTRRGRISLFRFYARRALRLLPALTVMLGVLAAAAAASQLNVTTKHDIYYAEVAGLLYVADYWYVFGHPLTPYLLHTWSLAVEEQFYIVWPPLLLLATRLRASRATVAKCLVVAVVAVATWRYHVAGYSSFERVYFAFDTHADALLIGCLLAVVMTMPRFTSWISPMRQPVMRLCLLPAAAVLASVVWPSSPFVYTHGVSTLSLLVGLSLFGLLISSGHPGRRVLEIPALTWVGRISYSLYLWHVPIFAVTEPSHLHRSPLIVAPVRLALTMAAACASHYLVERPFLRLKGRLEPSSDRRRPLARPPQADPVVATYSLSTADTHPARGHPRG